MANPNPNVATRFKPGQVANPSGRPKRLLTKDKFAKLAEELLALGLDALKAKIKNPATSAVEAMIASNIVTSIEKGQVPDLLMAYTVGKPVEQIEQKIADFTKEFETAPRENILKVLRDGTGG